MMTLSGIESLIEPRKLGDNPSSIWQSKPKSNLGPGEIEIPNPSVLSLPSRYVQGENTILNIGQYIQNFELPKCAIVIDELCYSLFADAISDSFARFEQPAPLWLNFQQESSLEEAERLYTLSSSSDINTVIAVGGGKALDTGKLLRHYIPHANLVLVPTIASTDAPCTALSMVYTAADHRFSDAIFFPANADLVLVDTNIIANAPVRYFVAGMGDAIATYYEAWTCYNNPSAVSLNGGRASLAIFQWAKMARDLLFEYGVHAKQAIENKTVTPELDKCIEANILASGTGAECAGLAFAHSFATSVSNVPHINEEFLHGEHVSVGVIAHLLVENNIEEAIKVAKFCVDVGLPISCADLNWDLDEASNQSEVDQVIQFALGLFVSNHPFAIDKRMFRNALQDAQQLQKDLLS